MQPQPYHKPTSKLQEMILKHICIATNADYKTISKDTDRDRITILQSLRPLIAHQYVMQIRSNPERPKSKLVFKPTDKGMMYSIAYLGVDIDEIRTAQLSQDVLENYKVFLRQVTDLSLRKQLEQYIAPKLLVDHASFDEEGNLIASDPRELLKQVLRISLFKLLSDKHFNIEELFKFKKGYLFPRTAVHPTEVELFRDVFVKIRNNLDASLSQLSG
jgi:hypothetical protein